LVGSATALKTVAAQLDAMIGVFHIGLLLGAVLNAVARAPRLVQLAGVHGARPQDARRRLPISVEQQANVELMWTPTA
jgi:hypothetical protein